LTPTILARRFKSFAPIARGTIAGKRRANFRLQVEPLEGRNLPSGGRWVQVINPAPNTTGTVLLLSSGTVMVQEGGDHRSWYQLTPSSSGSYADGSWSQLASMLDQRLFYASDVLPSGDVFVAGGEYSNGLHDRTNTGEIYDPTTNTWTSIPNFPLSEIGDAPSEVLPNGQVLVGSIQGPATYTYNVATNAWSQAANKLNDDSSSEETWVKLPGGSILSYSITASINSSTNQAQRYLPNANKWVRTGRVPVPLSSIDAGYEIGPAFLLPDRRVFFLGATGDTALYTPSTNRWTRGPTIPGLSAGDAPGAMLPDGQVIFAASNLVPAMPATPTTPATPRQFTSPARLFLYNPATDKITSVSTPCSLTQTLDGMSANNLRMLVLPTGQILLSDDTNQLWLYTASGYRQQSWKPTITDITHDPDGSFTLHGTQLNGISEGAGYGDDAQMATNYPIVQMKNSRNGLIFYGRTFDWSSTGVATGKMPETTKFTLPMRIPPGEYLLSVSANGISSNPIRLSVS
jgi:Kelch motif